MTSLRKRWTVLFWRMRLRKARAAPVVVGYVVFSITLGLLGGNVGSWVHPSLSPISSASAIAILGAIASGMMAFTGIVFSLLFLLLQFGSTAYSPRLARVLGRDQFMAHALGVFSATFLYALLAIRTVDIRGGPGINTPVITIAFLWLLASVAMVALMLPRIRGLSIAYVLELISLKGRRAAARLYPRPLGDEGAQRGEAHAPAHSRSVTVIRHEGAPMYVQSLDVEELLLAARDAGGILRLPYAIGDRLLAGDELAVVLDASGPISESHVRKSILLGPQRSLESDPAYALRLLVDIGIRALSPAVNDPTTAVMTLDHLEAALRLLARSNLDVGEVEDEEGNLRLVYETPTWDDHLSLALSEIHHYGRDSTQVQRRLGLLLQNLAAGVPPARRPPVQRFVERRRNSLPAAFGSEERAEASAFDPQGLGHTTAGAA